jgi:hypothetical protein
MTVTLTVEKDENSQTRPQAGFSWAGAADRNFIDSQKSRLTAAGR